MNGSNKRHLCEQVRRFRARFAQGVGATLGEVVPAGLLRQWVVEEVGRWRDRTYGPLVTLSLFLEQVLSADQSCQDAVARGLSERVALGQAPCRLKRPTTAAGTNQNRYGSGAYTVQAAAEKTS